MSSLPIISSVALSSNPSFNEHQWVIHIRRSLDDEHEDSDTDIPSVSIFTVPKTILSSKPEAYIPQQVALGPYHYLRSDLYDTERYKLAAAKKIQKLLENLRFQDIVDQLMKLGPRIRGHYDKYLNFNAETLAWMMVVDASFLIEFLQIYGIKEGKILPKIPSKMSQVVDYAGWKAVHNAILRDVLLLENQIPLFVLKMILASQYQSMELAEEILIAMLIGLCKDVSPFKLKEGSCSIQVLECAHLLDFLYSMIVPKSEQLKPCEIEEVDDGKEGPEEKEEGSFAESSHSHAKKLSNWLWPHLAKLSKGPILYIRRVIESKPVKLVAKLPWKIITNIPGFALLKHPVEYIFSHGKEETGKEDDSTANQNKPPLIDEITIPSVTELANSGVRFVKTDHDIANINFDPNTFTFHLPTINLDVHTEIVLRNLVAYEASRGSGPMIITRYTELMNGIIDTEEDATLLREKGIVFNHLKSDAEVADLWNGMSQSVKLTKVRFLDKVVEDVNNFYSCRWKVKIRKLMKVYVFGSWQILTLLAALIGLFLMTLQSVCSVYICSRILGINASDLTGVSDVHE